MRYFGILLKGPGIQESGQIAVAHATLGEPPPLAPKNFSSFLPFLLLPFRLILTLNIIPTSTTLNIFCNILDFYLAL